MQRDNSQRSLLKIAHAGLAPEFALKSAMDATTVNAPEGSEHTYADQLHQLHPTHSKIATWVSAVNFLDTAHQYEDEYREVVGDRIKTACRLFNLEDEFEKIAGHFDEEVKSAATAPDEPMTMADGSYPIFTESDVKRASSYLLTYAGRYDSGERRDIGLHIIKSAEAIGTEVTDRVHKIAGLAMPCVDGLDSLIEDRMMRAQAQPEIYGELRKLSAALKTASPIEVVQQLSGICDTVVEFDKLAGVAQDYNKRARLPEDFLYGDTIKKAAHEASRMLALGDFPLDADKIAEYVPVEVIAGALGEDIVGDLKTAGALDADKLLAVVPTLPLPDRNLLFQAISGYDG